MQEKDDWQRALDLWWSARDSVYNQTDPRIGIAFVQLATKKKADPYYEKASELYFWGLSKVDLNKFKETIGDEIDRISPILREEQEIEWQRLLDQQDSNLTKLITGFWVKKDPIPTSELNERLIEHWLRIAYAKEKFDVEETTVFGTDDRGSVFIKYGAPDDHYQGKLGIDQLEIMRWLDDFLLRQEIERYNPTPDFEIWIYRNLKPGESAIFLFGKKAGFGKYGLRYGIEEFIPERAFSRSSTKTTEGILPGAMLQLMYYRELMGLDKFYLDRFRELETLWANARASGRLSPDYDVIKGLIDHYESIDRATVDFQQLPEDKTGTLTRLEPLELEYEIFRYLDQQNSPRVSIITVSEERGPNRTVEPDFFKAAAKTRYKHRHVLIIYNQNWVTQERIVEYPALENSNTSVFDLSQLENSNYYTLVAEKTILDSRKTKLEKTDIPDTAQVIGLSSKFLGALRPLSSDSSTFEMSDIIVGEKMSADSQLSWHDSLPIIPKQQVRNNDSLFMYVEFYHLTPDLIHEPVLNLSMSLKKFKSGEPTGKKDIETIPEKTWSVTPSSDNSSKLLELDISGLSSGDYELTLIVTGSNSKSKKVRKTIFSIL